MSASPFGQALSEKLFLIASLSGSSWEHLWVYWLLMGQKVNVFFTGIGLQHDQNLMDRLVKIEWLRV